MKHLTAPLLALGLMMASPTPASAQADTPLGEEAQTDLEIIDGVPVNPELKKLLMQTQRPLTVQEMLELSNKAMAQQQQDLKAQQQADDSWMQDDPLGHLEGEMHTLVQEIDGSDTAEQTQARGEDVVRKMDTLIAKLEEASKACSGAGAGAGSGAGAGQGNQANGNQPAQDSTLIPGPGGSGDLSAAGQGNNRFEDLDPAQRDAILRAQQDQQGLPTEYDALLAEYFQRLASEEALDTAEPSSDE